MQDTDGQLLRSFASRRDEEAFRLLAKRHLGLVFHTALRRTGNRPLAEEISQNVLLAMARKSETLAKDPERLPAWLHRATLFESSKAMRAESNYQQRKGKFDGGADGDLSPDEVESLWTEALPHLDPALDRLSEADRGILLLHYFEGQPFPQIAERLGKNLAAVQKQSRRALEKLSRILRTKGVALSVAGLGAGLAANTAKAVSEAFIHSAGSFAIAGTSSPLAFSITTMIASKTKVLVPLALLMLATPLVLQQLAIGGEKSRIQLLRDSLSTARVSLPHRDTFRISHNTGSDRIDVMALANEQLAARRSEGEPWRRFKRKLEDLKTAVVIDLIRKTAVAQLGMERKSGLMQILVGTLAQRDPGLAMTTAVKVLPAGTATRTIIWDAGLDCLLVDWTKKDPASAIAWLREQEDTSKLKVSEISATGLKKPSQLDDLKSHMLTSLVLSEAPQTDEFLRSLSEPERLQLIKNTISTISLNEMRDIMEKDWIGPYLRIVREFAPEPQKDELLAQLARTGSRKRMAPMLAAAGATPAEAETMVRSIVLGEVSHARQNRFYGRQAELDEGLLNWLNEVMPGRSEEVIAEVRAAADQAAIQKAADTVANLSTRIDLPEEHLSFMLTCDDLSSHLDEALELADRIQDPALRQKTINDLKAKAKIFAQP